MKTENQDIQKTALRNYKSSQQKYDYRDSENRWGWDNAQ